MSVKLFSTATSHSLQNGMHVQAALVYESTNAASPPSSRPAPIDRVTALSRATTKSIVPPSALALQRPDHQPCEILHMVSNLLYTAGMESLSLPPDLEQFAAEAVAAGRYRNVSEVVAAGISLVRRMEAERASFVKTLVDAEAESDRTGWSSLEEVEAEMRQVIRAAVHPTA